MRLPEALRGTDDAAALRLLDRYYAAPSSESRGYTGAAFDTWDPSGSRAASVDAFTADDVVAVSLLSVKVNGRAVLDLLDRRANEFNELLSAVPADLDLADVEGEMGRDWPATRLVRALDELPGVGMTTATKLVARKRPRLRPIWDTVVARHLDAWGSYIGPLRDELQKDAGALHQRLVDLRAAARLSSEVSPLRVFDVIAWMEGNQRGLRPDAPDEVEGV